MQSQYYRLLYHFTWSTKARESLIDANLKNALYSYLNGKVLELNGRVQAIGGTANHVHLVASLAPNIDVSTFIGRLKGASSHWINHVFRLGADFAWQSGFGAFTVTDDILEQVCAYVNDQEEHHQRGTLNMRLEMFRADGALKNAATI